MRRSKQVPSLAISGLTTLAKTIVDPHDHRPLRFPTFPNVERTSVMGLVESGQVTVSATTPTYVVLVRSAACPLWVYKELPASTYTAIFTFGQGASMPPIPQKAGEVMSIPPLMNSNPSYTDLVGTSPVWTGVALDKNDNYWFWCPPGAYGFFTCHCDTAVGAGVFTASFEYTTDFTSTNSGNFSAAMLRNGSDLYYQATTFAGTFWRPIAITCTSDCVNAPKTDNIECGHTSGSGFFRNAASSGTISGLIPLFKTPPEFTVASRIYSSTRVTACSLLLQNTTAVLNKEGVVEAVCFSQGVSAGAVTDVLQSNNFTFTSLLADSCAANRYNGLLEKGCYTFALPDQDSSAFLDYTVAGLAGGTQPAFRLDSFNFINAIKLTEYTSTTTTNLMAIVDMHIEFRNTSMLWPVGFSRVQLEEWHRAQIVVQGMRIFYENPTHLLTIANLARLAAVRAYPYVAPVVHAGLRAARDKLLSTAASMVSNRLGTPQIPLRSDKRPRAKPKARSVVVVSKKKR